MYDLAIIGAGPAGATLARLLAGRYRILLVDKNPLLPKNGRLEGKCCGGLLSPDAQRMLARLGLSLPPEILDGPQLFAVRAIDLPSARERLYQRHYLNLDRGGFEAWLRGLVPENVSTMYGYCFKGYEREAGGYLLKLARAGGTVMVRARVLIGADGAASSVRRQTVPGLIHCRTYLAVQAKLESGNGGPYFTAAFDARYTDYYAWTIPKGDLLLCGALLAPGTGALARFAALQDGLRTCGAAGGRVIEQKGAYLLRPLWKPSAGLGWDRVALVGEAAGMQSPSSAEGISYAMESALCLAESLQSGLEDFLPRYENRAAGLRRKIARKRLKAALLYQPLLRRAALRTGFMSLRPAVGVAYGPLSRPVTLP